LPHGKSIPKFNKHSSDSEHTTGSEPRSIGKETQRRAILRLRPGGHCNAAIAKAVRLWQNPSGCAMGL
jgi:hypothetical protein